MNILFAPQNIASMPAITAESLNKIKGVRARYISTNRHKYIYDNSAMVGLVFPIAHKSFKEFPFNNILNKLCYILLFRPYRFFKLCRWIIWADVVHWNWDSIYKNNIDLKIVKFFKKKDL